MHQNPFKHAARAFFSPNKNLDISEYWYSTEACNLFHPKKEFHSSIHNCLVQRIKSFSNLWIILMDGMIVWKAVKRKIQIYLNMILQ